MVKSYVKPQTLPHRFGPKGPRRMNMGTVAFHMLGADWTRLASLEARCRVGTRRGRKCQRCSHTLDSAVKEVCESMSVRLASVYEQCTTDSRRSDARYRRVVARRNHLLGRELWLVYHFDRKVMYCLCDVYHGRRCMQAAVLLPSRHATAHRPRTFLFLPNDIASHVMRKRLLSASSVC